MLTSFVKAHIVNCNNNVYLIIGGSVFWKSGAFRGLSNHICFQNIGSGKPKTSVSIGLRLLWSKSQGTIILPSFFSNLAKQRSTQYPELSQFHFWKQRRSSQSWYQKLCHNSLHHHNDDDSCNFAQILEMYHLGIYILHNSDGSGFRNRIFGYLPGIGKKWV